MILSLIIYIKLPSVVLSMKLVFPLKVQIYIRINISYKNGKLLHLFAYTNTKFRSSVLFI